MFCDGADTVFFGNAQTLRRGSLFLVDSIATDDGWNQTTKDFMNYVLAPISFRADLQPTGSTTIEVPFGDQGYMLNLQVINRGAEVECKNSPSGPIPGADSCSRTTPTYSYTATLLVECDGLQGQCKLRDISSDPSSRVPFLDSAGLGVVHAGLESNRGSKLVLAMPSATVSTNLTAFMTATFVGQGVRNHDRL